MLHLTANPSTLRTKYRHGRSRVIRNNDSIHVVGQLFNPSNLTPNHWAAKLRINVSDFAGSSYRFSLSFYIFRKKIFILVLYKIITMKKDGRRL
jgi:hypothetical protein